MNALLFDCDGVLGDTERDGHLPAFNTAFAEFDLPLRWSRPEHGVKLAIGGGKERLASVFTPEFMREAKLPEDAESTKDLIARLHERKTEIFTELVEAGKCHRVPASRVLRTGYTVSAGDSLSHRRQHCAPFSGGPRYRRRTEFREGVRGLHGRRGPAQEARTRHLRVRARAARH